jgi:acetolactate synthase-1/2/3 large subunit
VAKTDGDADRARREALGGRRNFLKGVALSGVAGIAAPVSGVAQTGGSIDGAAPGVNPKGPRPAPALPRSPETTPPLEGLTYSSCGGDYMVDVLRRLGIEYFAAVPGNSFMGMHEAVVNYGMLTRPYLRTICAMHEEASVAIAHGYAKIEGKPMACMMHASVGLQHGSMAVYNAYADRVPIFLLTGAWLDVTRRDGEVAWALSANDAPAMVRDFTKWDDTPASLRHFAESAVRAYQFSMTPPYGPTLLAVDALMQEDEIPGGATQAPPIPRLVRVSPPAGEEGAVKEAAGLLVGAEHPVIYADRSARTPTGLKLLVELAELLQAPVWDSQNRFNFPWRHPLNQTLRHRALISQADVLLMLEAGDPFDVVTSKDKANNLHPALKDGAKSISISSVGLAPKGNYQVVQRYAANIDLEMAADAEATLPFLIEEVKRQMSAGRKSTIDARGHAFAEAHLNELNRSKQDAAYAWDNNPISMPRLCQELYNEIKNDDWSLVSASDFQSYWPQRLWNADRHHQYIGGWGAYGVGYLAPAGLGAALANQKYGRLSVSIVGDGDLMMGPGILWTAAHERIPLLYIVHNNRSYHQEVLQMQVIAKRRHRRVDRVGIACNIDSPDINYAAMARSLGVYSEGPIDNPNKLGPALRRAIAVVKTGEPALVDVISEGR